MYGERGGVLGMGRAVVAVGGFLGMEGWVLG